MLSVWKRETVVVFLPFFTFVLSNRLGWTVVVEEIIYKWQYNHKHIGTDDPQLV